MSKPGYGEFDPDVMERFEQAVRDDGRYPLEAFEFLHRGLEFATELRFGDESGSGPRHVTGQELSEALRMLAIRRWGPLAREVLRRWNIHATRDFGEMVYLMINLGYMGRQDSDSITDFDDVYDFKTAFSRYQIPDQLPEDE